VTVGLRGTCRRAGTVRPRAGARRAAKAPPVLATTRSSSTARPSTAGWRPPLADGHAAVRDVLAGTASAPCESSATRPVCAHPGRWSSIEAAYDCRRGLPACGLDGAARPPHRGQGGRDPRAAPTIWIC
jgi:hypothetical protein